jgi:hypothetical protein
MVFKSSIRISKLEKMKKIKKLILKFGPGTSYGILERRLSIFGSGIKNFDARSIRWFRNCFQKKIIKPLGLEHTTFGKKTIIQWKIRARTHKNNGEWID